MKINQINFNVKNFIIELAKNQIQLSYGCTEIGIVALACAKAGQLLPGKLKEATVKVSTSIYRNDVGVGVPNLGKCGMYAIAAAGFVLKTPEKKLSIVNDLTTEKISLVKKIAESGKIKIRIDYNAKPIYTLVEACDDRGNKALVKIEDYHDNITMAKLNGKETIKKAHNKSLASCGLNFDDHNNDIDLEEIYNFIKKLTINDVSFLREGIKVNNDAVKWGKKYAHPTSITNTLINISNDKYNYYKKNSWTNQILINVGAAIEARLFGDQIKVMTVANSGSHGIVIFVTLSTYAKLFKVNELKLLQSILFAQYITWYIKSNIGHLCAMCGSAFAAAPSAICGIAFQRGWSWKKINDLLNTHLCVLNNVACDGAKPSCAYKACNSLLNGFFSLNVIDHNGRVSPNDGIVCKNVEDTIKNYKFLSQKTSEIITNTTMKILDDMSKKIDNR